MSLARSIRLVFVALILLALAPPLAASGAGGPVITVLPGGDVRLEWNGALADLRGLAAGHSAADLVTIGGARLPAALVALRIAGDAPVAPQIQRVASTPWYAAAVSAPPVVPRTAAGEDRPDLAAPTSAALPPAPVVVLRDGWMRGAHIAVLALSPVFAAKSGAWAVTSLEATIPGAAPLQAGAAALLAGGRPFLTNAPGPRNPLAGAGWRVRVAQAGIQSLSAAALKAAGVPLANPALLHLYHQGAEVALEQRGAGDSLELRFYAPELGDRWNAVARYWLAAEAAPGRRMTTRSVLPGAAGASASPYVWARGTWRNNTLYDSQLPGPDGDHWYATDLRIAPAPPGEPQPAPVTFSAVVTPGLPLVAGTATVTVTGSSYLGGAHTLAIAVGGSSDTATWSGTGDWSHTRSFATPATAIKLTLAPGSAPDGYEIDGVAWQLPVGLDVGGRGASFGGRAGSWRYQMANAAASRALYDVSDPAAPSVLTIPSGASPAFDDGPAPHSYVLAGTGTLFAPQIFRSPAADLTTPGDLVYIAPAALQSALAPLVAQRQAQGHRVRVIDPQAIYDAWSFGQVAPGAIRDFLRYAAATWSTPPAAVALVGDGTSDPLGYTGRDSTNYIPPYLANVDPWLGETACEPCYARLDGDDPTLDPLPDLTLGRLPVRSAAELSGLVAKILAYENSALDLSWRSRSLYVADNYRDAQGVPDNAGDFAALADASVVQQPANLQIRRMYYDPTPQAAGVAWRERDPVRAYQRTVAALNQGAGLVNYIGHGSAYQWATTELDKTPPYLLGQYDPDDLTNGARQPIVLEMTCLTSAFQTPAFSGTTIDERLVLNPKGGAIAVWGPTGLGVAHGHDMLQRGFYNALWAAPPLRAPIGQLAAAGSLELFTYGTCCQDTLATYALLGDPAMPARVMPARSLYLPLAWR
jgi:hypothetical protein